MRKYFILFRAQTAPATVFTILIPFLLAGGDLSLVPLIFLFGTILHFASFGHNSVMDYWYDIKDPNKQHHPLERGEIKLHEAHQLIHTLLIIATILLIILTLYSRFPVYAFISLLLYIVFGHAYNDGLDKNTILSFLPISLCFTSLTAYGWFLGNGAINEFFVFLLLWAFLTIFYQIAWEGNLKDLYNPSELNFNMLRRIATLTFDLSDISKIMTSIRGFLNTLIIILLSLYLGINIAFIIMFTLITIIEIRSIIRIHLIVSREDFSQPDVRNRLLENFGQAEAFEFFRIATLLLLTDVWPMFGIIFLYGLVWFVFMNTILFGSKFGPRV